MQVPIIMQIEAFKQQVKQSSSSSDFGDDIKQIIQDIFEPFKAFTTSLEVVQTESFQLREKKGMSPNQKFTRTMSLNF